MGSSEAHYIYCMGKRNLDVFDGSQPAPFLSPGTDRDSGNEE